MGIEDIITGDVMTRLQDFSAAPLLSDEKPPATRDVMRYARKGGGVKASSAVRQLGVRTKDVTVRVMLRTDVGRPVKGDRKCLGTHAYGVAEYHGSRCYRVIIGTDSLRVAAEIAGHTSDLLGRDARVLGLLERKPRKAVNSPKSRPVRVPKSTGPLKSAPATADAQRLHMRDIDKQGQCLACAAGIDQRNDRCGQDTARENTAPAPGSFAAAMAATAHLRGE